MSNPPAEISQEELLNYVNLMSQGIMPSDELQSYYNEEATRRERRNVIQINMDSEWANGCDIDDNILRDYRTIYTLTSVRDYEIVFFKGSPHEFRRLYRCVE